MNWEQWLVWPSHPIRKGRYLLVEGFIPQDRPLAYGQGFVRFRPARKRLVHEELARSICQLHPRRRLALRQLPNKRRGHKKLININDNRRGIVAIDHVVYRLLVPFQSAEALIYQGNRGPPQYIPNSLSVVRHDNSRGIHQLQDRRARRFSLK